MPMIRPSRIPSQTRESNETLMHRFAQYPGNAVTTIKKTLSHENMRGPPGSMRANPVDAQVDEDVKKKTQEKVRKSFEDIRVSGTN